ncbi:MAG: DUF3298 and DUF4163 domain-containing protein [Bacteroidales bacterium]|nr:DUF3298 and DUF4163 domain-containing protein [Bacteroidales bacterium]
MIDKKLRLKNIFSVLRSLFFTLFIIVFSFSYGQEKANILFYKHMKGIINNDIQIVADISIVNNNISGFYYYYFDEHEESENSVYFGKTIPLMGSINNLNEFEIFEFNKDGAKFTGTLTEENKITGYWQRSKDKKKLKFFLNEYYPDGSMAFKVYYLQSECPLVKEDNSSTANIEIVFLDPNNYPINKISDSIRDILKMKFFGKKSILQEPEIMMINFEQDFFSSYKIANKDIYDGGDSFNWEKKKEMNIYYNENYILTLSFTNYAYTGGAHGLWMKKFVILDLKKGIIIKLDNIFKSNYKAEIKEILNTKLRQKYAIKENEKLTDAGFFDDEINISKNYYVNKDGVGFYYNNYEIASYATGQTDIFIPFKSIMHLIKIDSPVNRILNSLY